jgi:site-specific DNA recombinase
MPRIRQDEVERRVLDMMRHELMRPEAVAKFRSAHLEHWQSNVRERRADQDVIRAELRTVERNIVQYISAIEQGLHSQVLYEKLRDAERRQQDLSTRIADLDLDLPKLPEDLDEQYRAAIDALAATLSSPRIVQRVSEKLAKLIDRIVEPDNAPHTIEIVGDTSVCWRAPTRSRPTPTGRRSVR